MAKKTRVGLHSPQWQFLTATERNVLFCGGLGSGKTFAGAHWTLKQILQYPGVNGFVTANTHRQLKTATMPALVELLDEYGIQYKYNINDSILSVGSTNVYCVGMENYDYLRGVEVGWAWSDECAFYRKMAFDVLLGRIRDPKGPCQWRGTTTPNAYNWLYEVFVEKPIPSSRVIYCRTKDNVANLGEGYLETLQAQYDSRFGKQELEGLFVNIHEGNVYHAFDRNKHVKPVYQDHRSPIFIGLDFNVHPLCGVFLHFIDNKIYVFDELYQEHSNTFHAAKEIIRRYAGADLEAITDDSGSKRKTSSSKTDRKILEDVGIKVDNRFRNPFIKDRVNNINRLLEQERIIIDPNCKKLIKDLEQFTYEGKQPMLGHITDGLGYVVWKLLPMERPRRKATVHY